MAQLRIAIVVDDVARFPPHIETLARLFKEHDDIALVAVIGGSKGATSDENSRAISYLLNFEAALFRWELPVNQQTVRELTGDIYYGDVDQANLALLEPNVIVDLTSHQSFQFCRDGSAIELWRLSAMEADAGFQESFQKSANSFVSLWRQRENPDGCERIAEAAYNTKALASHNRAFLREKAMQLLIKALRERPSALDDGHHQDTALRNRTTDGLLYSAAMPTRLASRLIEEGAKRMRLRPGLWTLAFGKGDVLNFDPSTANIIEPQGNRYWADPFFLERNGKTYVFFEDYDYATQLGHIGAGELSNGEFHYIGPAMRARHHLSYPFIFEHGDALYMMPETHATKRIEVWRCEHFPDRWTLHATALDGRQSADSVLAEVNGVWRLFTNICVDRFGDHNSELHVFAVDGPDLKTINAYSNNPVVIDSRTTRGGGRVFVHDNRIFRVSQYNAHGAYGYGANLMEITHIDETHYEEKLVRRIEPNFAPGLAGCHHIDFCNGVFVMDVRKKWGGFPT